MDKSKGLKRYLFARVGKIEHNNFLRFNNDVKSFLNNCIDTFGKFEKFKQEYNKILNKNEMEKLNILSQEQLLKSII